MRHRAVIAVVVLSVIALAGSTRHTRPRYGQIRGRVYATLDHVAGAINPIGGAVVSNDSATTTTDDSGYFQLRILCPADDERLTLKARSGTSEACGHVRCYGPPGTTPQGHVYQIFFDGGPVGMPQCPHDPPSPPPSH